MKKKLLFTFILMTLHSDNTYFLRRFHSKSQQNNLDVLLVVSHRPSIDSLRFEMEEWRLWWLMERRINIFGRLNYRTNIGKWVYSNGTNVIFIVNRMLEEWSRMETIFSFEKESERGESSITRSSSTEIDEVPMKKKKVSCKEVQMREW